MNKCLSCRNLIRQGNRWTCRYHTNIQLYGDIGTEPLVESCGHVQPLHDYDPLRVKKSADKVFDKKLRKEREK